MKTNASKLHISQNNCEKHGFYGKYVPKYIYGGPCHKLIFCTYDTRDNYEGRSEGIFFFFGGGGCGSQFADWHQRQTFLWVNLPGGGVRELFPWVKYKYYKVKNNR